MTTLTILFISLLLLLALINIVKFFYDRKNNNSVVEKKCEMTAVARPIEEKILTEPVIKPKRKYKKRVSNTSKKAAKIPSKK